MHLSRFTLFLSTISFAALQVFSHPAAAGEEPTPRPTFVNERSDLNRDNVVDEEDLMIFMQDWGKVSGPGHSLPVEMVTIPAGSFLMGNSGSERDMEFGGSDEYPQHEVNFDYSFQMGKHEVTNGQFAEVLNWANAQGYPLGFGGSAYTSGDVYYNGRSLLDARSRFTDITYSGSQFNPINRNGESMATHPVKMVSWYGAVAFCNWLSEKEGRTPAYNLADWTLAIRFGGGYRLPSESEWEYACRGSANNPNKYNVFSFGDDVDLDLGSCNYSAVLDQYMVWCGNTPSYANGGWTNPVGSKRANDYGLHDMHGNVKEWCQDLSHWGYDGAPSDGRAWVTQPPLYYYRVHRGGFWNHAAGDSRSAGRDGNGPTVRSYRIGFRIVRTP